MSPKNVQQLPPCSLKILPRILELVHKQFPLLKIGGEEPAATGTQWREESGNNNTLVTTINKADKFMSFTAREVPRERRTSLNS